MNNNCNDNRQLFSKSRRMSSTSLNLFGMNKKEEPEPEIIEEEEEETNLLSKVLPTLKVAFPSFLAGGVVTLGFLFLPLLTDYYDAFNGGPNSFYSSDATSKSGNNKNGKSGNVNNVNQPVILFETILNDLNDAYVDDVDVQKLFETGVKAMTASLDPYTEFESRLEAQELEESVTGKYGGVGLVIRGGTNLALDEDDVVLESVEKIDNPSSSSSSPTKNGDKPVAVKDGGMDNKLDKKSPNNKAIDEDEEEDLDKVARKRARQKSREDGIRVVSAFEGEKSLCLHMICPCIDILCMRFSPTCAYDMLKSNSLDLTGYAYDAGFRVGDKLIKIDDFEIKPTTEPDEVRNHLRGDPGTPVSVTFLREGVGGKVNEPQTIELKRSVVRIPDVKYFGKLNFHILHCHSF